MRTTRTQMFLSGIEHRKQGSFVGGQVHLDKTVQQAIDIGPSCAVKPRSTCFGEVYWLVSETLGNGS